MFFILSQHNNASWKLIPFPDRKEVIEYHLYTEAQVEQGGTRIC